VQTPRGPVVVPANPQRVIAFDRRGTLGYMLDLGLKPIAAMTGTAQYGGDLFHPLLEGQVQGIARISSTEPSLEQVAGLRPDLIIGYMDSAMTRVFDQLTAIAPTVAVPIDFNKPEEELTFLGTIFGLEAKAAAARQDFRNEVTAAVAKIKNPGKVSIILPVADGVRIYSGENLAGQLVTALGGSIVPDISTMNPIPGGMLALVSFEQVNLITGDTILMLANLSPELKAVEGKIWDSALFQTLPAVKAGRVLEIESQAFSGTAGLTGQRQILDVLTRAFA
jgi:iron complex transport system substrate-binding protein